MNFNARPPTMLFDDPRYVTPLASTTARAWDLHKTGKKFVEVTSLPGMLPVIT